MARTMASRRRKRRRPQPSGAAFASLVARRVILGVGHFMPREQPEAVSSALLEVLAAAP